MRLALPLLALLLLLGSSTPAFAGSVDSALHAQGYWHGFLTHWEKTFAKQDTIVVTIMAVGAVGIFIITRGRKRN